MSKFFPLMRRLSVASLATAIAACGGGGGGSSESSETTTVSPTAAPSTTNFVSASKFAAHVSQKGNGGHLLQSGVAQALISGQPVRLDNEDKILQASIKTANKSDLLVGVSLQNGLFTDTLVSGKNGSSEVAKAMGAILVRIEVDGKRDAAFPSNVVFAEQIQELSATLSGVIQSCKTQLLDSNGDGVVDTGEVVIARDCIVTEEQIGLALSTTSANHFNFVVPNVSAGTHTVTVHARAVASAEFTNGLTPIEFDANGNPIAYAPTANNAARGFAVVDVGTLAIEQVRAINQEGGIVIDMGGAI